LSLRVSSVGRATLSGRVRWGGERWLYVYLLLEFQATVDPFMALRVMVYVGLLYQHLIKQRQLPESGKLPAILPLVLYNGFANWGGARDIAELIEEVPGGLELYRPQLRYCLLDERRIAAEEIASLRNVAAALFRLEQSRKPEESPGGRHGPDRVAASAGADRAAALVRDPSQPVHVNLGRPTTAGRLGGARSVRVAMLARAKSRPKSKSLACARRLNRLRRVQSQAPAASSQMFALAILQGQFLTANTLADTMLARSNRPPVHEADPPPPCKRVTESRIRWRISR